MVRTKVFFILLFLFTYLGGVDAVVNDTLRFRVTLVDKLHSEYSINRPEEFLSKKAIDRRERQGVVVDESDLPVSPFYKQKIASLGARVLVEGKWENFVTIGCNDTCIIADIRQLPFVKEVKRVWTGSNDGVVEVNSRDSLSNEMALYDNYYGAGEKQIKLSKGDELHQAGYKGKGVTIAVIDAGFHNLDSIKGLDNVDILGVKDFVDPLSDIYAENSHGLAVLSCMAMNKPYYMVGTAPEASYWLLRSEDDSSEQLIEQDYWAAAIEFADSVGVDVVNTSLGYNRFDDPTQNYKYRDLNGKYSLISRQASSVADKGIILVCSAGNAGFGTWKKITVPADAEHVLTVGAVGTNRILAPFSSIGNTADGRVKPDVMAVGLGAEVMGTAGSIIKANGTSFAAPIMCGMLACLREAYPDISVRELIQMVREAGDRAAYPDNIYGYGVPNIWQAFLLKQKCGIDE